MASRFSPRLFESFRNIGNLTSPGARSGQMIPGSIGNIAGERLGGMLFGRQASPQQQLQALIKEKGMNSPEVRQLMMQQLAVADPAAFMEMQRAEALKKANDLKEKQKRERTQRFRESLIARNKAIGGSEERGKTILEATDPMLLDIRKEILAEEQAAAAKNAGSKGRLAIGKQAGLTEEQVKELSSLTDDQFGEVISGVESSTEAYKNTNTGSTDIYRVNRFGMVGIEKPNGATEWEDPLDLDLVPAVKETKDIGRANELTKQLAAQGTKDFGAVTEAARQAYRSLDGFAKRLQILDDNPDIIAGGKLSQLTVDTLITLGSSLGVEIPATASAEEAQRLMALGVDGVAQTIKAFGAGTGLSDADRLFAQFGAGATLELTAANIREMIEIAQKGAEDAINLHQGILDTLREENASEASLALFRAAPSMPTDLSPYYSQ
jgi:hypothetical protein